MGKGWCIVAIPEDQDPVWKHSSEKVPHMTLLFLGEQDDNPNGMQIAEFIQHVAKMSLQPFYQSVKRRGSLGPDEADVLFFEKDRGQLENFRTFLLTNPNILKAYNSVEQYPEWTPHLTMGYPKTPAIPYEEERSAYGVFFNRIALWTGDSEGPTFELERRYDDSLSEVAAMSDTEQIDAVDQHLAHYGVPGMKWGRRMVTPTVADGDTKITKSAPGTKVKAEGGRKIEAHDDAKKAAVSKQKAKASTTDSLSNKELQDLVTRMNLEQQYTRLSANDLSKGQKFVKDTFGPIFKQQAQNIARDQASSLIGEAFKRKAGGGSGGGESIRLPG